jgi:KipI family sensor histidine kinase inhibitor
VNASDAVTPGPVTAVPVGDTAVLLEPADADHVLGLFEQLHTARPVGVLDVVPAARTLLLHLDPAVTTVEVVVRTVTELSTRNSTAEDHTEVDILVDYDGPDLEAVGDLTGLGPAGVVELHTSRTWRVAFTGFAPGFGYLLPDGEPLRVPRRPDPRRRVPAGAVALADAFSGVYPRPSPGGWQLIGRTDETVWDLGRDPPARLRPGTTVRFVARG